MYVCLSVSLCLSFSLFLPPSFSLSLFISLSTPADYMYVPAQEMHDIQEGEQKQISYVLLNPPSDGGFEFAFNVTLSTESSTATGMPEAHISCIYSNSPETALGSCYHRHVDHMLYTTLWLTLSAYVFLVP